MADPDTQPNIGSAWRAARDRFAEAGIDTPSLDARCLAEAAFGFDAVQLMMHENDVAGVDALARLNDMTTRRLAREPVARILGEKAFYGLAFSLSADTLVPRPETELLVELGLAAFKDRPAPHFVDLGTGTGCVAIALVANLAGATAVVTDLSADALATARVNAARHGVAERVDVRHGDWFAALDAGERFDLIVSNPPYIVSDEIAGLDADVSRYDPHLALDGGTDGLDPYRVIAGESGKWLRPGGRIVVEHGLGQSRSIAGLFTRHGLVEIKAHDDLNGHARAIEATWPG